MLIEKDARRYIVRAIEAEQAIRAYETRERVKGRVVLKSSAYDQLRRTLVTIIGQLNSVANSIGKGRDDFVLEILLAAEDVSRTVSSHKSAAIRRLAENIKTTFAVLRSLFCKYAGNLEAVDPQLKNNRDLAEALVGFERAWEKGKEYLLQPSTVSTLISFSRLIEGLTEKYSSLGEKVASMDSEVFMVIPCIAILRSLDLNDHSLYRQYYPELEQRPRDKAEFQELQNRYAEMRRKADPHTVYNVIERAILEQEIDIRPLAGAGIDCDEVHRLVHEIKRLAVLLQRSKPADWNSLMETAMGIT